MARSTVREKRRKTLQFQWERLHKARRNAVYRRVRRMLQEITNTILWRLDVRGTTRPDSRDLLRPGELYEPGKRAMVPQWRALIASGVKFEFDWIHEAEESKTQRLILREIESPAYQTQTTLTDEPPPSIYVDLTPSMRIDVDTWIANRQVGFWAKVEQKVFRPLIEKMIATGIKEGWTLPELRRELRKNLNGLSKHAAERIARTETTSAMNYGGQIERAELEIEFKSWISTIDILTRTLVNSGYDHMAASGQVVENGSVFVVSGERLLFPGDGTHGATAGNVINCRCAAAAHFDFDAHKRGPSPSVPASTLTPPAAPAPETPKEPLKSDLPGLLGKFEDEKNDPKTKQRVDFYTSRSKEVEDVTEKIRQSILGIQRELKAAEDEDRKLFEERKSLSTTLRRLRENPDVNAKLIEEIEKRKAESRAKTDELAARYRKLCESRWTELEKGIGNRHSDRSAIKQLDGGSSAPPSGRKKEIDSVAKRLSKVVNKSNLKEEGIEVRPKKTVSGSGYNTGNKDFWIRESAEKNIIAHEFMHAFEHQAVDSAQDAVRGMLFKRIEGIQPVFLDKLHPNAGYKSDDFCFPGAFKLPNKDLAEYASRYYSGIGRNEILTVAMESMYNNPIELAESDPEWFRFVAGWMKGLYSTP